MTTDVYLSFAKIPAGRQEVDPTLISGQSHSMIILSFARIASDRVDSYGLAIGQHSWKLLGGRCGAGPVGTLELSSRYGKGSQSLIDDGRA